MKMDENQVVLLCLTLLLSGVLAFFGYYLAGGGRRRRPEQQPSETASKNVQTPDEKKQSDQREVSKRQAKSKKRREAQQEFTHPWMVGALKGHTAPILDIDFSANGKFLASCAEDCGLKDDLDCTSSAKTSTGSRSRTTAKPKKVISASSSSSSSPPSPSSSTKSSSSAKEDQQRAILSRRQRKNRTRVPREQRRELRVRDENREDDHNGPPPLSLPKPKLRKQHHQDSKFKLTNNKHGVNTYNKAAKEPNAKNNKMEYQSFNCGIYSAFILPLMNEDVIASMLRTYKLSPEQLIQLGYPVNASNIDDRPVLINYQNYPIVSRLHNRSSNRRFTLDANAQEFVPKNARRNSSDEVDSGNGSSPGSSSVESSDLEQERNSDSDNNSDISEPGISTEPNSSFYHRKGVQRRCVRCSRNFFLSASTGEYLYSEKCCYHWGRLRNISSTEMWDCCKSREISSKGCTTAKQHVWTGLVPGPNGPFYDFVRTQPANYIADEYGVYALDCEMVFTRRGLEVGKVTMVSIDGQVVYDALIKPEVEVIDYNTRFSGLRAKDFEQMYTKTLQQVQREILIFVNEETILVGHGLENDLRVLKILHPTVVDTCVAYPHFLGYPYRSSLKMLAKTVLRRDIQVKEHDSAEDARIAMDLMLNRLCHDFF